MSVIWSLHLNTTHLQISKCIYVSRCKKTRAYFTKLGRWCFTWNWALASGRSSWIVKDCVLSWLYSLSRPEPGLHQATWRGSLGLVFISFSTEKKKASMWILGGKVGGGSLCHQLCLTVRGTGFTSRGSLSFQGTAFAAGPHPWRCSWWINNEQVMMRGQRGTKLLQGCCGGTSLREQWRKTIIHVFLIVTLKLLNILNPLK